MNRRHVYALAVLLALASVTLLTYKHSVLGFPLMPGAETEVWAIEATVGFRAGVEAVTVDLQIPRDPPGFAILNEDFISKDFGRTIRDDPRGGRQARWHLRRPRGRPYTLYYRIVVHRERASLGARDVPRFPKVPELAQPYQTAMETLIDEVREHSSNVATFTAELIQRFNDPTPDEYVELFVEDARSLLEKAETITMLLAAARIPARVAHGVMLGDSQRKASLIPWLEVHNGSEWLYFDPASGNQRLPEHLFIWWRGDAPIAEVDSGNLSGVELAVQRSVIDAMLVTEQLAVRRGSRSLEFSLFDLPIQTQAVYSVLLMIPIGALVMIFMRNIIGVKTFGTFMPVLIALAFRETRLLGGIVLFTIIVALGLAVRFYLEKLRLLLVPRLSVVLTVVVMLMATVSVISHRLGIETGLSLALFPMVILTMVIERMSIVWEERGPAEAIQQGLGSLLVAALAYVIMGVPLIEHLIFVFPELLLLVAAIALVLGRYTGYRVTELFRFQSIGSK